MMFMTNAVWPRTFALEQRNRRKFLIEKTALIEVTNGRLCKMNVQGNSVGSFIILGFVIFIVGLLTGMLAIALIPVKPDFAALEFMIFIFGFLAGILTITLALIIVRLARLRKKSVQAV
jgi:hypothetical protein